MKSSVLNRWWFLVSNVLILGFALWVLAPLPGAIMLVLKTSATIWWFVIAIQAIFAWLFVPFFVFTLASSFAMAKRYDLAEQLLKRYVAICEYLRIFPLCGAKVFLFECYCMQNKFAEAEDLIRDLPQGKWVSIRHSHLSHIQFAEMCIANKNYDGAESALTQVINKKPVYALGVTAIDLYREVLRKTGRSDEAEKVETTTTRLSKGRRRIEGAFGVTLLTVCILVVFHSLFRLSGIFYPNEITMYSLQAVFEFHQKRYDKALACVDKVMQLQPNSFGTCSTCGANFSFSELIKNQSKPLDFRLNSKTAAIILLVGNRSEHAAQEALNAPNTDLYRLLIAYCGYRLSNHNSEAQNVLNEAEESYIHPKWPCPVVQFLSHKLDADRLLAVAKDKGELTEAHTYVGLVQMLDGDKASAKNNFQWVMDNGRKNFFEYDFASVWLDQVCGDKAIQ